MRYTTGIILGIAVTTVGVGVGVGGAGGQGQQAGQQQSGQLQAGQRRAWRQEPQRWTTGHVSVRVIPDSSWIRATTSRPSSSNVSAWTLATTS